MMISRQQTIGGLQKGTEAGEPIIATAADANLVVRVEEKNDADLVVVYNFGPYRMNGITSVVENLSIGDASQIMYDMGKNQILPMVDHTPIITGIYGVDPIRDIRGFLAELWNIGYWCAISFLTIGKLSDLIRKELEQVDLGFAKEAGRLQLTAKFGFVTLTYCYSPEEAEILARADTDIIVSYAGLTTSDDIGVKIVTPVNITIRGAEKVLLAAKKTKSDVVTLCHGGPIISPEDAQGVLRGTCAMGFVVASSIERLPVEKGISGTLKALRSVRR